ncbi:MAG: transcription termination/antitermination NusG family protein [Eggerthellaceae bacterium]|nr:transcription termination/antitermination NusG family protein [Eggerthellaceae bacterium]
MPERGLGLMWYAIQVETGREDAACEDVRYAAGDLIEECFVPKYRAGARLPDGSWGARDERLLPGYLVCDTRRVDDVAARLRRARSFARVLGSGDAFVPLSEEECAWLRRSTSCGQRTVGESVGYMDDGRLVVLDGPLAGREDWVRKIDYHRRVAYLDMPMGGRKVAGQAGLRMVSKAKGRLLAKELTKAPTNKE